MPIPSAPPSSQRLDINYTHHHILSFNTANISLQNPLSDQIKALKLSIVSNSPGMLAAPTGGSNDSIPPETALSIKAIIIDGTSIQYDANSLSDPPTLSYKVDQLEKLVYDWDHSAFIKIDGVGIPLCHWKKMYSWTRPKVWKHIKDQWTKYKFIVEAFKFYGKEEFMETVTVGTSTELAASPQKPTITGISEALRRRRNDRNKRDVEEAKLEYDSDEFSQFFSYKKGGRKFVMRREQDVARLYRKMKNVKVYWDEDEEAVSEGEVGMN